MFTSKQLGRSAFFALFVFNAIAAIAQAPSITRQPASFIQVPPGTTTNFFVEATNAERYQWYRGFSGDDSNPVPGETNALIVTPRVYEQIALWVRVSNGNGSTDSQHGRVNVTFPGFAPNITNSPASTTDVRGATIVLRAGISGTPLVTYQWQKEGENITGETNLSLVLSNLSPAQAGNYSITASNYYGTRQSEIVTVTVRPEGYPGFITKLPAEAVIAVGSNLVLSPEVTGAEPLSIQWYNVSGFGNQTFPIFNATNATLIRTNMQANNGGRHFVVLSNAQAVVTNSTTVRVVRPPQIATFADPEIRVSVGQQLGVSIRSYSGQNGPYSYQWFKNGSFITTNENIFKTAELSDTGEYYVIVSNIAGSTTSVVSRVTVYDGPVPAWIRLIDQDRAIEEGTYLSLSVQAEGGFPLYYTWYHNGTAISQQQFFSTNTAALSASGQYYVVVTNSTGAATSSIVNVFVYPQQTSPGVQPNFLQTNGTAGNLFALSPTVTGTHLVMQWYKQVFTNNAQTNIALVGETNASLTFNPLNATHEGTYIFWATNYKGLAQATYILTVISPPVITTQPQPQEAVPFAQVNMGVSAAPFNAQNAFQWYLNGAPIPGRTSSSFNVSVSQSTTGSYYVVITNNAGAVTSEVAVVSMVQPTAVAGEWKLVADRTVPIPGRPGLFFQAVGDAKLENGIVTFQGGTNFPDTMGLYRWDGTNHQIVDRNEMLPNFTVPYTYVDGVTLEQNGAIHFVGSSTNSRESAIIEFKDGQLTAVVDENKPIPSRPGLNYNAYGYPARGGGKTAFFAFNFEQPGVGTPRFRSIMVWDGATATEWVNGDTYPEWSANSSQVGFDGNLVAWWAADKMLMSRDAGPIQTVVRIGDAIPGGGSFSSLRSPPHVEQGRILFNGGSEGNVDHLVEWANGTLTLIAKEGTIVPGSVGGFTSVGRGFYAADGSILFEASGPGVKNGVYRWNAGTITPFITSLNTLNGRQIRRVFIEEASGDAVVIMVTFDDTNYGIWTNAGGNPRPQVTMQRTSTSITVSWEGAGALEETSDLFNWGTVTTNSPATINFSTTATAKFYRVRRN